MQMKITDMIFRLSSFLMDQVLGIDAGGTKAIDEQKEIALRHPLGFPRVKLPAHNIQYMLENSSERERMGTQGRKRWKRCTSNV